MIYVAGFFGVIVAVGIGTFAGAFAANLATVETLAKVANMAAQGLPGAPDE